MDLESRFWELCDEADRLEKMHGDCHAFERPMIDIIDLVEANPDRRELFVSCFSQLVLWQRAAPWALVPFCMRRLRFPEIQELVHRDAVASEGTAYYARHMNFWSDINHAFTDDVWEDAEMFPYYSHEKHTSGGEAAPQ